MSRIVVFLAALLLAGCATPYQRLGFSGGYSETQLGKNIFHVSFRGNGYTSRERASNFCLLRAAELALEKGFRYFVIVESEKHAKISISTYTTGSDSSQTDIISKPRAKNTILCFKDKPKIDGLVFDAEFVVKSIKQKYGIQ